MSVWRSENKRVGIIEPGEVLVHQSDQLRTVETKAQIMEGWKVIGIKLTGYIQGSGFPWSTTWWNPDYEVKVLVENE